MEHYHRLNVSNFINMMFEDLCIALSVVAQPQPQMTLNEDVLIPISFLQENSNPAVNYDSIESQQDAQ